MKRRLIPALLGALALAGASAGAAHGQGETTTQESGSPINDQGSSYHYRTYITSITPHVHGLSVEVLEFADRLLLRNDTGQTVTIYGYSGEPYARVLANGATEQNKRSPAVYLNTSFYGQVTVPPSASATAAPAWAAVDRTGQFEWHDHRIHWMSPVTPPQVKDTSKRTKIFDWSVPIKVGDQTGAIRGELFWVPESSSAPTGLIVVSIVIVLGALATVVLVRRRRRPGAGGGDAPAGRAPEKEAW
ncbi:MAG TPA: hypothetical protein VNV44_12925 [Solirubrobacteraceae bacterium]|jgi:hypothetical protein|nr:hypothetical protein [Solirubrobacteraceae bacterium]